MDSPAVARRVLEVPFDDQQKEAVFSVLREHGQTRFLLAKDVVPPPPA